jgi:hypothetical protein
MSDRGDRDRQMRAGHGSQRRRDGEEVPRGQGFATGMFGRMFPDLPELDVPDESLIALGKAMTEPSGSAASPALDNRAIPAGYTYLGQFIDHDLSFDTTPVPERQIDALATRNFRTPALDLDSLYGLGPVEQPYLYDRANKKRFVLGSNAADQSDQVSPGPADHDLPRGPGGYALIGDPRNDEHLVIAQLHVAMLKFHNRVEAELPGLGFDDLRRTVTWHYQWIVTHDFLGTIMMKDEWERLLWEGPQFYRFADFPFIPVEFSAAAYRLHTMVRGAYDYNRFFGPGPNREATASLENLFRFTGLSGTGREVPVPSRWAIDWRRFFAIAGQEPINFSRRMDAQLTEALANLPGPDPKLSHLAVKNLLRGQRFRLPSGQAVARAIGLEKQILTPAAIGELGHETRSENAKVAESKKLLEQTPLWYYLMKEAEILGHGATLGPVGSRIVGEVIFGLLLGDPNSYLHAPAGFTPTLGSHPGAFAMGDLLEFVGDVNPLG